jgi:malate dehydrogenase (oxaloacetate-decarboxylating)(NADP+)
LPHFGGINLEDIKVLSHSKLKRRLVEELDIPAMHDDQHGTAIIHLPLYKMHSNQQRKKIENANNSFCAGSAALACANLYVQLGVRQILSCLIKTEFIQ